MSFIFLSLFLNLEKLQHQPILNPIDPQLDPLNGPPVNPIPQINPLPNAILPQNQSDPMQDKLEKIESVLHKTSKIDGYLFNLKNMCPYPDIRLPKNFKFPDMDKFDGTGNPVMHLRMFVGTLQPVDLESRMFYNLFHRTLTGAAAQWFLSLEDSKTRNWEDIMDAFVAQYNYNIQLDVTLRDLETTRQNSGKTFVDFLSC